VNAKPRLPVAIMLEPEVVKPATKRRAPQAMTDIIFTPDELPVPEVVLPRYAKSTSSRGFRWGAVLVSALFGLVSLWAGLAITQLVEGFFARSPFLGWLALGVAAIAGFAALAIIAREIWALFRLRKIEETQRAAAKAINQNDAISQAAALASLKQIYADRPETAWGLQSLASHDQEIHDPRDRMRLAERYLVSPLDEGAHRIIARRARRVTLLTTVTPAAALDIIFVAAQNLMMMRELATLYGGRPSTLSTLKLARMVVAHLAVAGGLALSDNLLQHLLGKGLLGRLSARFGEGAVNGILTTRIGLATCDVCRPIPQEAATRETLGQLLRELVNFKETGSPVDDPKQS
jgi:putative membrane protein